MTTVIFLIVVSVVAWRATTPETRARAFRAVIAEARRMKEHGRREAAPFREALRARTRWVLAVPAIAVLQIGLFVRMGGERDSGALVAWGGNLATRTTNGEWWRLLSATFVYDGFWALVINTAALLQVGLILEQLVGPLAFSSVYLAAALFASLATIWAYPTTVSAGASGAIFGLYGLLGASFLSTRLARSEVTIPIAAIKRLAPVTALFLVYNLSGAGAPASAAIIALAVGATLGAVVAGDVSIAKPPSRRVAIAIAVALALAALPAFALRGITDVRPEMQRLVAMEHRTSGSYEAAAQQLKKGQMTAGAVVALIERSVIPELQAADARIAGLQHVPSEDAQRVADARLYLRLRSESWRLSAATLRSGSIPIATDAGQTSEAMRARAEARYRTAMLTRGKAEATERAALEALDRIAH